VFPKCWAALLLLSLVALWAQSAGEKRITPIDPSAQKAFEKQVKVALLVGIGAYPPESGLSPLKYPVRDVTLLGSELERQGYLVRRLTDAQASRGIVRRSLAELAGIIDAEQSTFLFYYSGHGFANDGVNYLATYGTAADDLRQDGLAVSDIASILKKSMARRQVMWLDACRNDPGSGARATVQRSFADLSVSEGLKVLYSTRAGSVSYENDGLQQGLFTHFLVRGLRGEAARDDGLITFDDLAEYVVKTVRTFGVQQGQVQAPFSAGESSGDFLLAQVRQIPGAAAPIIPIGGPNSNGLLGSDQPRTSPNDSGRVVEVSVRDSRGNFIPGIPNGNFRVLEDGLPRTVTAFSRSGETYLLTFQPSKPGMAGIVRVELINPQNGNPLHIVDEKKRTVKYEVTIKSR
jgi:Caspase domain